MGELRRSPVSFTLKSNEFQAIMFYIGIDGPMGGVLRKVILDRIDDPNAPTIPRDPYGTGNTYSTWSQRCSIYFTKSEYEKFRSYCESKNQSMNACIHHLIFGNEQ